MIMNHRGTVGATDSVSVVEQELLDHFLVLHSKLRTHDVLLDLLAELHESPAVVEFDFKFYLLGARIFRIGIGVLIRG